MTTTATHSRPHVAIAGAGIGGLTAALRLHEAGLRVTVLEAVREPRPLGVGINLQPRAVGILTELGLGTQLDRVGVRTRGVHYFDEAGTRLHAEPTGLDGGYAYPQRSVHRGELQLLLLEAVRDRLGDDAVRTGARVEAADADAAGVTVRTGAGDLRADALVGADGLHSALRRSLHGEDPLLWSGQQMWRGTTVRPGLEETAMAIAHGPDGATVVTYPIGPALLNWVVIAPVDEPGVLPQDASWNAPGDAADLLDRLGGWDLPELGLAAAIEGSDQILEYPLVDREPLATWGRDGMTLLGDAAHPVYPFGANGGSQAVVDGDVLAEHLAPAATERDAGERLRRGLTAYEAERRPQTTEVVHASRELQRSFATRAGRDHAGTAQAYRRRTDADRLPAGAR